MGLLAPALSADAGLSRALDDRYYPGSSSGTGRPIVMSDDVALAIPAVYACTALIAEDIGKVPLGMYQDLGEKGNQPAPRHPLHDLLHYQPNEYQNALEWREMVTAFALLRGMGVSEIHDGQRGPVDTLEPLHPDLIREETTKGTRRLVYRDPRQNFTERTLLLDEVFIVRGRMGRSAIAFAGATLTLEIALEKYSAFMFTRGSKHQGVISSPKLLSDPVRTATRKAIDEYGIDGPRAGRPLLLEDGMRWESVSLANKDMEYLAQRQFGITQICRLFRVPPHKIAQLERSTNNNIERQSIDYVTDTLLGWAVRWEQAIRRDLIVAKGTFFAKHNLDGLLRGDSEARAKAYTLAIQWGWMTRNEVREKEDMNPLPGLDEPLTPLNMQQGDDGAVAVSYAPQALLTAGAEERHLIAGNLKLFASDAASRVVRRELAAMMKLADRTAGDPGGWAAGVEAFYAELPEHVTQALHIPDHRARAYSREQRDVLLQQGPTAMEDWLETRAAALTDLALDQEELAA